MASQAYVFGSGVPKWSSGKSGRPKQKSQPGRKESRKLILAKTSKQNRFQRKAPREGSKAVLFGSWGPGWGTFVFGEGPTEVQRRPTVVHIGPQRSRSGLSKGGHIGTSLLPGARYRNLFEKEGTGRADKKVCFSMDI